MTAQMHERLVLNGEETSMASTPPLPDGHPRLYAPDLAEPYRPGDPPFHSTACWRGYQGSWEVRDGRLYLTDVRGKVRMTEGEPVFAEWFSGVLRVPRGPVLHYVHMGFSSTFEQELYLSIESGLVVGERLVDYRGRKFDELGREIPERPAVAADEPQAWWRRLLRRARGG